MSSCRCLSHSQRAAVSDWSRSAVCATSGKPGGSSRASTDAPQLGRDPRVPRMSVPATTRRGTDPVTDAAATARWSGSWTAAHRPRRHPRPDQHPPTGYRPGRAKGPVVDRPIPGRRTVVATRARATNRTCGTAAHSRLANVVPTAYGLQPTVRFSGLLEDVLADDIAQDLLALCEALTNIAGAPARSDEVRSAPARAG